MTTPDEGPIPCTSHTRPADSLKGTRVYERDTGRTMEYDGRCRWHDVTGECALWYWRHHVMAYDLHDSEAEAAAAAVVMEEYEHGAPVGIQFPDGRLVRAENWPAYREAQRASLAAVIARSEAQPRPTRQVIDPFNGKPVNVDVDEPPWLGRSS